MRVSLPIVAPRVRPDFAPSSLGAATSVPLRRQTRDLTRRFPGNSQKESHRKFPRRFSKPRFLARGQAARIAACRFTRRAPQIPCSAPNNRVSRPLFVEIGKFGRQFSAFLQGSMSVFPALQEQGNVAARTGKPTSKSAKYQSKQQTCALKTFWRWRLGRNAVSACAMKQRLTDSHDRLWKRVDVQRSPRRCRSSHAAGQAFPGDVHDLGLLVRRQVGAIGRTPGRPAGVAILSR